MTFSPTVLALIGLLMAAWLVAAGWAFIAARLKQRRFGAVQQQLRRLSRMVDESPALPLLVRTDGRIEAPARLAEWLGLSEVPKFLTELDGKANNGGGGGFSAEQLAELTENIRRTQKTSLPFRMVVTPRESRRSLALRGHLADPLVSPGGSALVWIFDFSDSESQLVQLRAEAARAKADFAALVALIESAPMPMWFRANDGRLRLVNSAYVAAVGGESAEAVFEAGIELIEPVDGFSAAQVALEASASREPVVRKVTTTIAGQRRAMIVSDFPLGENGIAGYAIDIEEQDELNRTLAAFREAQRSMLDQLSAGIAQFNAKRELVFANQPFQRNFALTPAILADPPPFDRLLDLARDLGRVPEVRDFPAWRREHVAWFLASEPVEEAWVLGDGTHLRVVAQPMPDGGLLLISEDRTEQLQLSATRDTLLRTRTATFDSLFESVAVFAPDGRLQLWNRRFARDWGLENELLDTHPHVSAMLEHIATRLVRPQLAKVIGDVVRGATLDRKQTGGRASLTDGRTLRFTGVPLPDGNGLLAVLDITDAQKAEQALRERNAALVEADTIKTRFLANMSYEFRTPLTSIGGFAELLQNGIGGDLSAQGEEYVAAILSSAAGLTEQIESVLDLSQSEAGLLPMAREDIELLPFISALVEERRGRISDGGITLDLRGSKSAGRISGDRRRLARALGHLIDNAIHAVPRGGQVKIELGRNQQKARIAISDTGPGMDASALARALGGIRQDSAGNALDRRQGLGLPLARQLVEAHGGTLELLSEPGEGAVAIVELP